MKILIADDHPFTLQGTKSFVESYGHKVTDTCSNGISALNLITLHQPDIAILDINMPGLDGLDVAKSAGKQTENQSCFTYHAQRNDHLQKSKRVWNLWLHS